MQLLNSIAAAIRSSCSRECDPLHLLHGGRQIQQVCEALLKAAASGKSLGDAELEALLEASATPHSDQTLAAAGTQAHRRNVRRRNTRKNRVMSRLCDVLLLLRPPRSLRESRAWKLHNSNLKLIACKTLILLGKRESAMPLLRMLQRRALELEDSNIELECCLLLRQDAALRGDLRAFEDWSALTQRLRGKRNAELYAAELLQRHALDTQTLDRRRKALGHAAEHYWSNLNDLRRLHSSHVLETAYRQLRIQSAMALDNIDEALELCREFKSFLTSQSPGSIPGGRAQLLNFDLVRLHCFVHRSDPAGLELGMRLCAEFDPGELNRSVARLQVAILALRLGRPRLAAECREAAGRDEELLELPPLLQDRWFLIEHNLLMLGFEPHARRTEGLTAASLWEIRAAHLAVCILVAAANAPDGSMGRLLTDCTTLLSRLPPHARALRSEKVLRHFSEKRLPAALHELSVLPTNGARDEHEYVPFEHLLQLRPQCRETNVPMPHLQQNRPAKSKQGQSSSVRRPYCEPSGSPLHGRRHSRQNHFSVSQSMISIIETSAW